MAYVRKRTEKSLLTCHVKCPILGEYANDSEFRIACHSVGDRAGVHAGRCGGPDRARNLEERLDSGTARHVDAVYWELTRLRLRGRICNGSVGLLAVCGMLLGATVMALFVGETSMPYTERIVPWTFLGAVGAFVFALLLFLAETLLATHTLRFGKVLPRK